MHQVQRNRRIISVRTPVVVYEGISVENQATQADGLIEILHQVDVSAVVPKQMRSYENIKAFTKERLGKQSKSFDGGEFKERTKTRTLAIQHVTGFHNFKYRSEPPLGINCKGNYYQDILNRIAGRINKLRKNQVINLKNKEGTNNEVSKITSNYNHNNILPKTRSRFRSENGFRNRLNYLIS